MTQVRDNRPFPRKVASFEVTLRRFLDKQGKVLTSPLPDWATDLSVVLPIYRTMLQARIFDKAALNLQRSGRLGTFASPLGQEAIGAAICEAMQAEDVLIPSYREFSAQLQRGVRMEELLLYWGGDERGSDYQHAREDFPVSIPVGSHSCHAAGIAYAFKYRQQARVAVCFLGDGATSKGDFYESLNAAGIWKLPLVFVVSNNQWAISVPVKNQTAAQTLAQKAIGAGIENEQVDGNDAIALHAAARDAIEFARQGRGARLIEALTYRMGDHTTADDATRYRPNQQVESMQAYDSVNRLRNYLLENELWSDNEETKWLKRCEERSNKAIESYLATPAQPPESMFDYLYAELPEALRIQRASLQQSLHDEYSEPVGEGHD